jgi:ATP-binding cassette, subfamily A (ABC1), member 3
VGLIQDRKKLIELLNGGAKRKLSLGMALVGGSQLIFLDEPTSGLDPVSRHSIWSILENLKKDNKTMILTTHHLDEAEILADRIAILSRRHK